MPLTYCNPLPLMNYQRGKLSTDKDPKKWGWMIDRPVDFREMADPTVIKWGDKWYLFPSCGMLWHSDDMVNWEFHPIEPFDPGYAPTVVEKDGYLYLTACADRIWRAKHPFGPWEDLGELHDENGNHVGWADPMLFVDDDGSMYCYNGLGKDGIYVVKLKDGDYTQFDGPRVNLFEFNPDHIWERSGEYNQNPDVSYIEGSWMTKHNGKYYIQYSGPGTELKCYAVGCYVGDHPMGPFTYQKRNPILIHRGGMVNGCGHHSVVEGPDGNLWCFYTTLVRQVHFFERRIGMDPVGFDENGEMFVAGPSETPQLAPGLVKSPFVKNDAGLMNVSVGRETWSSSWLPARAPICATDDNIRTWWEPEDDDKEPWIMADLSREYEVHSARTIFGDLGLDYDGGVLPGPYKYIIEGRTENGEWTKILDMSGNEIDRHIAYDVWEPFVARFVRLTVLGVPKGMKTAVWEFTVFGRVPS